MFADDVRLRSESGEGLQALLDQAATWAVANDMTWNVAKCSEYVSEMCEYSFCYFELQRIKIVSM